MLSLKTKGWNVARLWVPAPGQKEKKERKTKEEEENRVKPKYIPIISSLSWFLLNGWLMTLRLVIGEQSCLTMRSMSPRSPR